MARLIHLRNTTVVCTDNMKDKNMFNSQQYTIRSVTNDKVVIKENKEEFTMDDFRKNFNLAFCITVYKYEGDEIDTHYNIWDAEVMNKKQLYTALIRTTKFKYIHTDNLKPIYTCKVIVRNTKC